MPFCCRILGFFALLISGIFSGCAVYSTYEGPILPYAIRRGDTLDSLSNSTGVSIDTIVNINELDDPDELHVGQILYLPSSARISREPTKSITAPAPSPLIGDLSFVKQSDAAPFIGKIIWPVDGGRIGSRFGARSGNFHEGIDVRADVGTSVYAAHAGTIAFSGKLWSGYGNMIVLKGKGIYTVYAHNNRNFVDEGDIVERGDEIASVGKSGNASGPHLHFEVRIDDDRGYKVAVNPLIFLNEKY